MRALRVMLPGRPATAAAPVTLAIVVVLALAALVLAPVSLAGLSPRGPVAPAPVDRALLARVVARARALPRLHTLIVEHAGVALVQRNFRGPGPGVPVDVKSVSKIVIDTLVGVAIDRGVLEGTDQEMLPLLGRLAPGGLDPRVATITLDELLSMRAGLERTSGPFYGPWVSSGNWVHYVLTRPFVDKPGGQMLYSTGDTHLLSAILTEASGRSTWQLARSWLGAPLGIRIPAWTRDPQGIYLGGNQMALSPRALVRIGETYRLDGIYHGHRVVSSRWVHEAWTARTLDRWGHGYGFGWFISHADGRPVYFGWGYGGQMLYVVPSLKLTVVITSDAEERSIEGGYVCQLHDLLALMMPAFMRHPPERIDDSALCARREGLGRFSGRFARVGAGARAP